MLQIPYTNDGCNQFLKNCVTTGQGCLKTLGLCSTYTGTDAQCNLYIGTDGNCKGTGTTTSQCQARQCDDASKTINTDSGCNQYQKGCITDGAGCVVSLQLCSSYTGTATTCLLYKGSDGNCMAPSTQITDGPCSVKVCSNATQNTNTNQGCQSYSYKCVTNGTGCIQQPTCETTQFAIACEGNSSCSPGQICLDRSSCANYYNILCSSLPTTLATDQDCDTALSGCVTKGNGCVDLNDNCSSYSGLISTCQKFKGLNGTQACTQLTSETNTSASCFALTLCSQAKLYSSVTQSSNGTCDTFLKGCFFNGADNCTNGDCTTYFGTLTTCSNIATATNSNKPQTCWKVDQPTNGATACIPRTCAHATVTVSEPFNTDPLCQSFMQGCVWNGKSTGGCQDASTACSSYTGTTQTCGLFAQSGQKCTKTTGFCKTSYKVSKPCNSNTVPTSLPSAAAAQVFCQQFVHNDGSNVNCYLNGGTCAKSLEQTLKFIGCQQFVASGSTLEEKNTYCSKLKHPNQFIACIYASGDYCSQPTCDQILALGSFNDQKSDYCYNFVSDKSLEAACKYNEVNGYCYDPNSVCEDYTFPSSISTFTQKVQYCSGRYSNSGICRFTGTGTNCQDSKYNCSDFTLNDTEDNNKIICKYTRLLNASICQIKANGSACEDFSCNSQVIVLNAGVASTNINKQQFCAQNFPKICGFDDSSPNNCKASAYCDQYKTYGADVAANRQLCQKYTYSDSCAYAGGNTCKDFNCDDVTEGMSIQSCMEYHPRCLFDGEKCVGIQSCDVYSAKAAGSGQLINCSNLTDFSQKKCGYASGASCKERECQDIQTGGSDAICSNYINSCVFNGTGCIAQGQCNTYAAFGSNSQEKGSFCNTRTPSGTGKCTFVAGASNCSAASTSCSSYQISTFSGATPEIGCSLLIDSTGLVCQYISGNTCSDGDCSGASSTAQSDADCQSYKSFCKLDTTSPCSNKTCSNAPTDIVTDAACVTYRVGCVTNGKGCIESNSNCSDFKGSASTCANFIGNNGSQLCGNSATALATDSCKNRACDQNQSAKSDQDCDKWIPPQGSVKSCVWNGTSGCVPPQNCSQFQGTIETCPKYTAMDGPCSGSGTTIAACSTYNCLNAPLSYNTDVQCKSWGPNCMTNGFGCIPIGQCTSIALHTACPLYTNSLGCDLAKTCKTKPQQCGDFSTATECNNTPISGLTLPGCGWNAKTSLCGPLTCANLPLTLTTDQQCSQSISNCTTTGSGCIVKAACSTYPRPICGIAATTDTQKLCIWSNSICRPIQCTDNITATSDAACDTYLSGCKTTGKGCGSNLTCPQYLTSQVCNKDYNGNPCIWLQTQTTKSCINYTKCTDVVSNSHKECQNISPHCTTNGINCIAITSCAKTLTQVSCIIGTDGNCGWLPASGTTNASCSLFTNCTAAMGKTTQQCQAWSNTCISDGVSCISKSQCSSYLTHIACQNLGTDGTCIWIADQQNSGTCRLQLCSDANTNNDNHNGCSAFLANTKCTTSGTSCISLSTCSQYKAQAGCVQGTDGDCFWQTPLANSTDAPVCRLKQCSDNIHTTSAACLNSITGIKCVSNGVNCIIQSTCSTYTTKEACLGGGTDGQCAFTPESNTSQNGKCQLFQSCENANQDQITCNSRQDSCYFNSNNGTTTTQCQPHSCQTIAQASQCQPVPSFDLRTYQICVLTDGKCIQGSPSSFTAINCYQNSVATYSWNPNTQTCSQCKQGSLIVNNTNNQTNSNNYQSLVGFFIIMTLVNI